MQRGYLSHTDGLHFFSFLFIWLEGEPEIKGEIEGMAEITRYLQYQVCGQRVCNNSALSAAGICHTNDDVSIVGVRNLENLSTLAATLEIRATRSDSFK